MTVLASAHAGVEVRISYVGGHRDAAFLGVSQGLSEANLQGRFSGQTYVLAKHSARDLSHAAEANTSAIVAAVDAGTLKELSRLSPGTPVFNLTLDDDDLRAVCRPNLLHVVPSQRMKEDAVAQWRQLKPEAPVLAQAWHREFEKYSGVQLNNRFRKAQGRPMDDAAWAGWAAVKMLADTVARERTADPGQLLDYFKTRLSFDGQKGIEMNFRPNGQLRQILLIVEKGKIVGEAPVQGVVDPQDLDSLGPKDCAKH